MEKEDPTEMVSPREGSFRRLRKARSTGVLRQVAPRTLVFATGLCVIACTISVRADARAVGATTYCPPQLVALVNSLSEIDGQMTIGLSFAQYKQYVATTHVAYARVAWNSVPYGCLTSVGVPAERAMNAYTAAYSSWAQCIQKIYGGLVADCTSGPGYSFRQRQWHIAHLSRLSVRV